ncbi:uncharacterized protein LOC129220981 [Uloborus diversus]|uniref:uncharacterized protein LOC129220981 n=1 Tax=Uloborus diversus TaxID=327109 RepID=UPI0024090446|nr:uncharacterized protein LOC129220981 [Uloborus diversus]
MVTVSSPPPQLSSSSLELSTEEGLGRRMDDLLGKLKENMMELILQGDDVTRQMWHMYSVFEEIFGSQTMTTSTNQPLKQVVVGDRLKGSPTSQKGKPPNDKQLSETRTSPIANSSSSPVSPTSTATDITPAPVTTTGNSTIPGSSKREASKSPDSTSEHHSPENKPSSSIAQPHQTSSQLKHQSSNDEKSSPSTSYTPPQSTKNLLSSDDAPQSRVLMSSAPAQNPLLDTIGALANANQDSDDSDLDIVYQQLRYRGRHRKPEQVRIRTHRQHQYRHSQIASSDPESIGYAGSNSVDSGYKSLCATPEVSDSLSAPEVRRSASDVSASDSSTTSGRPRSLDGGGKAKIKMGTRSVAGKMRAADRSPRHASAMNDVTLDHLMYLRQSLRKDRKDTQRSPESIPSSATSSTFRDSDLSPRTVTDDEWRDPGRGYNTFRSPPPDAPFTPHDGRSSRGSSRGGEDIDQEGGGESSSDFLLSRVEYYDLESIQEFPPSNNYVTMLEEKTRCARFQIVPAPKSVDLPTERHISSLYRKSESSQSVDGGLARNHQQFTYGATGHAPMRTIRNSSKVLSRHHRQHHATDSKLTEAAIRVLEMIEDFRMEEAMSRSGRLHQYQAAGDHHSQLIPSSSGAMSNNYPSSSVPHQMYHPRYRKSSSLRTGARPASTGSLIEQEIDARSMASASSYAASAEHHVYEEIMYDLVCERAAASSDRAMPPPIPPERGRMVRSRLLPVPPHVSSPHHQPAYSSPLAVDPRRLMLRSHKHRSNNMYSMLSSARDRDNVDRFLEMEWHLAQERDKLPPDFPI